MSRRFALLLTVAGLFGAGLVSTVPAMAEDKGPHRQVCLVTARDPRGQQVDTFCIHWG